MTSKGETEQAQQLLNRGSEIAGAAIAGAVGFIVGGPIGGAASAALGASITHALQDMSTRFLSSREAARIGGVAAIALDQIKRRLESGEKVRDDVFVEPDKFGSMPCEEIFEGVLIKAKNSYEQKKVKYFANLYANISFDSTCSVSEANHLITLSESLTYTQFCLLQLFSSKKVLSLRIDSIYDNGPSSFNQMSLLQSTHDLLSKNLIVMLLPGSADDDTVFGAEPNGIIPNDCVLSPQGKRFYNMLGLSQIAELDYTFLAECL